MVSVSLEVVSLPLRGSTLPTNLSGCLEEVSIEAAHLHRLVRVANTLGVHTSSSSSLFIFVAALGDLWRYDMVPNHWVWLGGQSTPRGIAEYSPLGVPTTSAQPGSRVSSAAWLDVRGDLWLFGGFRYNTSASAYCVEPVLFAPSL
jgi:hypothetical protein